MGSRPHAIIVYGFAVEADSECIEQFEDRETEWEQEAARRAGLENPAQKWSGSYMQWTDEQQAEARAYGVAYRAIKADIAKPVLWGAMFDGDPNWHFGIVLAETDWDDALDISKVAVDPTPAQIANFGRRVADACEFFGIEHQECRLCSSILMLRYSPAGTI